MNKKYQVFISSTFKDLAEERQHAMRIVLDLGHIPSGMEIFPAADVEQFEYIKKVVDECDYYVLIIGARYGSVDANGVSFTEKEYDYAVEKRKTVLVSVVTRCAAGARVVWRGCHASKTHGKASRMSRSRSSVSSAGRSCFQSNR
jgi:hypothetical protein